MSDTKTVDPSFLPTIVFENFRIHLPDADVEACREFVKKDPNVEHYAKRRGVSIVKARKDAFIGKLMEFGAVYFFRRLDLSVSDPDLTIRTTAQRKNMGFDPDIKVSGLWKFVNPHIMLENHTVHVKGSYKQWGCCGVWNLANVSGGGGKDRLLDPALNAALGAEWVMMGSLDEAKPEVVHLGAVFAWKTVLDNNLLTLPRRADKQDTKRVVYLEGTEVLNSTSGRLEYQRGLTDLDKKFVITDDADVHIDNTKAA